MTKIQISYPDIDPMLQRLLAMMAAVIESQGKLRGQADVLSSGGWIGRGSEAFYEEFYNYVLPALGKLEAALEVTIITLRKAVENLRAAEEDGARLFSGDANNTPSQRDLLLARLDEALKNRKLSFKDLLSLANNGYGAGIGNLLEKLPGKWGQGFKLGGLVFQLIESGIDAQNLGQLMEQLAEGGVQIGTELTIEAGLDALLAGAGTALMIGNSLTQFAGKVSSGYASLLNDITPDPALADAIRHFDVTLENVDLGSVTGSFSAVVVDVLQMGYEGGQPKFSDPFTSALSIISPVLAGAIRRPDLAQELSHNTLTFVGSVVDFGVSIPMLPYAAADLNANTLRVTTHTVGQFFNLPPELNTQLSNTAGNITQFLGDSVAMGLVGRDPRQHIAEFNRITGLNIPPTIDMSTWLGNFIPSIK